MDVTTPSNPSPNNSRRISPLDIVILSLFASAVVFAIARGDRADQLRLRAAQDIQTVLDRQVEAWNRGDLDGFMAGYWNNSELTFCSGGTVTKGWQPTFDRYKKRYQSEGKEMGKLTFDEIEIESITDKVALVRGRWKLALSDGKPEGLFTLKMERRSEGWRVVYDHTSVAETPK